MKSSEIAALRQNYSKESLDDSDVDASPMAQFQKWFEQAVSSEIPEPNAMTLATAGHNRQPHARVVLLKGIDERGFIFYSNYESRKGLDIAANDKVSLCFNWLELERQVTIDGVARKVPEEESVEYFNSRPYESRIGALTSHQSSVISGRAELESVFRQLKEEYEGKPVPKPDYWGGYVVKPSRIEFWQGRPGRLHDRIEYTQTSEDAAWVIRRLSP